MLSKIDKYIKRNPTKKISHNLHTMNRSESLGIGPNNIK